MRTHHRFELLSRCIIELVYLLVLLIFSWESLQTEEHRTAEGNDLFTAHFPLSSCCKPVLNLLWGKAGGRLHRGKGGGGGGLVAARQTSAPPSLHCMHTPSPSPDRYRGMLKSLPFRCRPLLPFSPVSLDAVWRGGREKSLLWATTQLLFPKRKTVLVLLQGLRPILPPSSCCSGMEGEQGDLHRLGKILLLLLLCEGSGGFEVDRRRQGALAWDPVWAIDEDPFYVAIVPLRRPVPMYDASIIFSSSKVRKEFHFF